MAGESFTDSGLAAVNTMVSALFTKGFATEQRNLPWGLLATDLGKSTAKNRSLDFLGDVPRMTEMGRDSTQQFGVARFNHTMTHTEYSAMLAVRMSDLATDQMSQYPGKIAELAKEAAGHPGQLLFAQLEANPTGYDTAAYFANTHAFGAASNIDNLAAGTGVTSAAIETDIAVNRATMMRYQTNTGVAMGGIPDLLVIPPELSIVFAKTLGTVRTPGGVDNTVGVVDPSQGRVWKAGGYTVFEWEGLSDTNNWYMFNTRGEIKPFLYSWIVQPRVLNTPSFNDDSAKNHAVLEYVVYGEYGVQVSLPQLGIAVVN